jgi:hypothetical protein
MAGTEIQPWTPSQTLSLECRAMKSKEILALSTSPLEATKLAEQIVGLYPHVNAPNPKIYAAGLAAVLSDYPLGLVQECAHPRTGIAREREFPPTPAALVAWLDKRLAWHQALACYQKREKKLEPKFSDDHRELMLAAQVGLANAMKNLTTAQIAGMTFEQFVELGRGVPPKQQAAE